MMVTFLVVATLWVLHWIAAPTSMSTRLLFLEGALPNVVLAESRLPVVPGQDTGCALHQQDAPMGIRCLHKALIGSFRQQDDEKSSAPLLCNADQNGVNWRSMRYEPSPEIDSQIVPRLLWVRFTEHLEVGSGHRGNEPTAAHRQALGQVDATSTIDFVGGGACIDSVRFAPA